MSELIKRGKFVVFEGGPGAGKDTQIKKLLPIIERNQIKCFREPGGTAYGELVRCAVQDIGDYPVHPVAAFFGYSSTRANLVMAEGGIVEHLDKGVSVFLNRYWYSTYAYQGAEGIPKKLIRSVSRIATGGLEPNLVLYYDIDPEIGQLRNSQVAYRDRYDVKELEFLNNVRTNYWELANKNPRRWVIIDSSKTIEEVHLATVEILTRRKIV